MAKGWSGSPKHTGRSASSIGGRAPAESGPRIGPGVLAKRMTPEYVRSAGGNGDPKVKNLKVYQGE